MSFSTPNRIAGTLARWDPRTNQTNKPVDIEIDEEIYIGRDRKRCQYVIDDPSISNKHLRIYTIIFDRENPDEIAPLVYARDLSMNGTTWNGYPMGKSSGSLLLSHGDILQLAPDIYLLFQCEERIEGKGFDVLQTVETKVFQEQYAITGRKLGSGAYGQVYMAYNRKSGQQFACKVVDLRAVRDMTMKEIGEQKSKFFKNKWQECISKRGSCDKWSRVVGVRGKDDYLSKKIQEKLDVYHREARVLESLSHPNIISMEKVVNSSNTVYLFQDLMTAGDLFSFIQYKGGRLGDIESAVIIRQVLMALDYLHERDIVHRDLKPDNILMTSLADGDRVVLTDFGCARLVKPMIERMSTMTGTFEYSAPEVLRSSRGGYTKAVDLWSLGCVTAVLLTGDSPFRDPTMDQPAQLPKSNDFERLEGNMEWHSVGPRARDFVRQLLLLDESKRMTVKQALRHSWFTNRVHKREFEALYRRSIKDWKPRVHQEPLIVDLCSLIPTREPVQVSAVNIQKKKGSELPSQPIELSENCFQYSSPPFEGMTACGREISPTLSDPELPKHNKARERNIDQENTHWLVIHKQKQQDSGFNTALHRPNQMIPALHQHAGGPKNRNGENVFRFPLKNEPTIQIRKRTHNIWDILEGEVYEDVDNAVTGKRQQLIYGSNVPGGH